MNRTTNAVIPAPVDLEHLEGTGLELKDHLPVTINHPAAHLAAEYFAEQLTVTTGYAAKISETSGEAAASGSGVVLKLLGDDYAPNADGLPGIAAESYQLTVENGQATISADAPAGLQHGVTTLVHLISKTEDAFHVPAVKIEDSPRYSWRGLSVDISRSFIPLDELKEIVDVLADLKYNVLHLHLCDDQGWRLEIKAHPELTATSGKTAVDGGRSGFLTQAEYSELVQYAANRSILTVPEIDVPGHTHALLHALPIADVGRTAPEEYTGIEVGFSELRLDDPTAVSVLTDILIEVAELTPGPWIHIGGDEPLVIPPERYSDSVAVAERLVQEQGKKVIGWNESVRGVQDNNTLIQHWDPRTELPSLVAAARRGHRVIMSPATHVYLDMKYTKDHPFGQEWVGYVEVKDSYEWEPTDNVPNLPAEQIVGVEAAIWTEKIPSREATLSMLLPRLAPIAEVAWSPQAERDLDAIAPRLAAQARRWEGRNWPYHPSPQVDWDA